MTPRVTVCGLGPGGRGQLTDETRAAIERSSTRFLRTARHPTAGSVTGATAFDDVYDRAADFDQVYREITETIVAAAEDDGGDGVCYVVPGSPLVLENTVSRLRADPRIETELVPALSFLDQAWVRLGIDPVEESVRLVDGYRFAVDAAGERGPLLVAHAHAPWLLSAIKLALDAGEEQPVTVLQRLGTDDELIVELSWPELDRAVTPDHLTTLYLPEVAAPVGRELAATVELMSSLRRDCPWDRSQDHASLGPYLIEESYEVLEAIDEVVAGGPEGAEGYEHLEEELGDLWFQILFHAELATEAGQFTVADVARTVHEKLVRRHPHVFGEVAVSGPDEVVTNWEAIKRDEKERDSALDGIPGALPALSLAAKTLQRGTKAGSPADLAAIGSELAAALPDPIDRAAVGRRLLALVELARRNDVDAEGALRAAVAEAGRRFRAAEGSGATPAGDWVLG